jgi:Cytochrome P460
MPIGSAASASKSTEDPIFLTKIPAGYRDWRLVSVTHEAGNLNSFSGILGNDVAIKAYRAGKLSFPDGAIIAALHWSFVSSEGNNKVFGRAQSFVLPRTFNSWSKTQKSTPRPGAGGSALQRRQTWRQGVHGNLLPCHQVIKARDYVFTRYAP